MRTELQQIKREVSELKYIKYEVQNLKIQNKILNDRVLDLENYSRRYNIIVTGLKEEEGENCRLVCKELWKHLKITDPIEVVRAHRMGVNRYGTSKEIRPLLIKFRFYEDKEKVTQNKRLLKGSGIFINDHLCTESMRKKNSLYPVLKELQKVNPKAHMRADKIFSNGRLFDENNIYELPIDAHLSCTKFKDDITLFSGRFSKLSNLYPCKIEVEGQIWNSVEHIYQFKKVTAAGNPDIAAQIIGTENPMEAMFIGKRITPPDPSWNDKAKEILKEALSIKFKHPAMRLALLQTQKVIGEATKHSYFGTGLTMADKQSFDPKMWTGKNVMGSLLMEVRKELGHKDTPQEPH